MAEDRRLTGHPRGRLCISVCVQLRSAAVLAAAGRLDGTAAREPGRQEAPVIKGSDRVLGLEVLGLGYLLDRVTVAVAPGASSL